eukprot:14097433-Ditylum_brightwellii.AAC.1
MVEVAPRTWPGMNKLGGTARITSIHLSPTTSSIRSVDVSYVVMGGREKNISMEYITPAPQYELREDLQEEEEEEEKKEE